MSDRLSPIRRLYAAALNAPGTEPEELGPDEAAEEAYLRPVVEALSLLPRERPDAAVIDEVVAAATFASVRSLYREDAPWQLPPGAAREAAELVEVKLALDELPPVAPDAEVVEEVVALGTHQAVRAAYDEQPLAGLPRGAVREAAALGAVKQALDRLPRSRPDPHVIDAVVAAAAVAAGPPRAPERAPVRAPRRRRRVSGVLGAVGAVFLAALVMLAVPTGPIGDGPVVAEQGLSDSAQESEAPREEAPPREPETVGEPTPAPSAAAAPSATRAVASAEAPDGPGARSLAARAQIEAVPQLVPVREAIAAFADEEFQLTDSDLRLLYLRLEALQADSRLWDEPPVVLGAEVPARPAATHGWMQVRVDR